jgi:glutathione S-transferase
MIKLYGSPMSTCTRKVLATLHETNTPFEIIAIDVMKGEHKQPEHMARQPFGQVPAIEDDGFSMFESRAIARYIDAKAGGKLTPTDLKHRAKMDQWMSVEVESFTPHAMKFVYEHIFKRPQAADVMANATQRLELACSVLDKNLAGKTFMVGDQFTLADITFAPYIEYAINTPAKEIFAKHANFMSWWGRVSERPSWMKAAGRAK